MYFPVHVFHWSCFLALDQVITWTNVYQDLLCSMASADRSEWMNIYFADNEWTNIYFTEIHI